MDVNHPRLCFVTVAFLFAYSRATAADPGAVEGVVTSTASGAPVKSALVTLRSVRDNSGYQALTDLAGRFRFDNVDPGDYGIWAEAQGFFRNVRRDLEQPVSVVEGQTIKDLAIQLVPAGVVSGRVLDENGEAIPGARLKAMRYSYSRKGALWNVLGTATSDDRGEYRVFDLEPGRWYLGVGKGIAPPKAAGRVHRSFAEQGYAYTFHPDTPLPAEAGPIEVPPGAERNNIDFQLRKIRVYHLRGKVIDARSGQAAAKAWVDVDGCTPDDPARFWMEVRSDGTFDVWGMVPGTYCIAGGLDAEDKLVSETQRISITDRNVNDIVVHLAPPYTIHGTATVEGASVDKLQSTRVVLEPLGWPTSEQSGKINNDGTFVISSVRPGRYRVMLERDAGGLCLRSLRFEDQDVSEHGLLNVTRSGGALELGFGSDPGQVEGTVQADGSGRSRIRVTLAPEGRYAGRLDLVHTVTTDGPAARFRIEGVAPGAYRIFAWELLDQTLWEYPEFRKLLESRSISIEVRSGERRTILVTAIPAAEIEEARKKLR